MPNDLKRIKISSLSTNEKSEEFYGGTIIYIYIYIFMYIYI